MYLSFRMLRISICFLRSINKHYTKPQKRQQHVCGWGNQWKTHPEVASYPECFVCCEPETKDTQNTQQI